MVLAIARVPFLFTNETLPAGLPNAPSANMAGPLLLPGEFWVYVLVTVIAGVAPPPSVVCQPGFVATEPSDLVRLISPPVTSAI